jgi:uncharacterized protein
MNYHINWFEIPTLEVEKSTAFYEDVFELKSFHMDLPNIKMRIFGSHDSGFALCAGKDYIPSPNGIVVYISVDDIEQVLQRVETSGGQILQPKKLISETVGYMALIKDMDGNRIALKSLR